MNYDSVFLFTFISNIRFLQRKDIEVSYPRLIIHILNYSDENNKLPQQRFD